MPSPRFSPSPQTVNILGVNVSAVSLDEAVARIGGFIAAKRRAYVCVRDAHGILRCRDDAVLADVHDRADLVTPDGMPLVWMCKWYGVKTVTRVYGPDLLLAVCGGLMARGVRHYFYGGAPGVGQRLADSLVGRFGGLPVAGVYCPPFRDLSDPELMDICATINAAAPDIVWVGLSSPKQEYWMARARPHLDAAVLIGIGAAFDFHSGEKRQAPRWIQRSGFEWLFRAVTEPRRLGMRYLKTVPRFALLAAGQLLFGNRKPQ
mgnify:CR=1 FL=1